MTARRRWSSRPRAGPVPRAQPSRDQDTGGHNRGLAKRRQLSKHAPISYHDLSLSFSSSSSSLNPRKTTTHHHGPLRPTPRHSAPPSLLAALHPHPPPPPLHLHGQHAPVPRLLHHLLHRPPHTLTTSSFFFRRTSSNNKTLTYIHRPRSPSPLGPLLPTSPRRLHRLAHT